MPLAFILKARTARHGCIGFAVQVAEHTVTGGQPNHGTSQNGGSYAQIFYPDEFS